MAITTMDGLLCGLEQGKRQNIYKASLISKGAGMFHSLVKALGRPTAYGSNPPIGSGEIPTKNDIYTMDYSDRQSVNSVYIGRVNLSGSALGSVIIYDRLWHNSGLVANITTPQTVNSLPLTRYTSGRGVEIWGEVYTATGATASTLSVNYIDANDVARVATYSHPASAEAMGQMFPFNVPSGAVGVKSIQSAIWSATTGTAGNFGLTLVRRLAEVPIPVANIATNMDAFQLGLPSLEVDCAVCMMMLCSGTTTGNITGGIDIIEG